MAQQSSDEEKQHNARSGQGFFKWKVTGDLLTQFKNAKHKQEFDSPPFKTIDGTIWKITFYPRGAYSPEYCNIFLECVTLCANKARIGVNYSFNIRELDWSYDMGETFRYDGHAYGPSNPFKPQVLNDLSTLTIECAVEETMNVSEGTTYFEWNVTKRLLRQWKDAKYKQRFYSPRFDAIGGVWYFGIQPNGKTTEGEAYLVIVCQSIASDQINVCHVTQSNNSQMHLDGHTIKKGGHFACKSPFQHKNIVNETSVTIGTKLWAKGSFDDEEERFISKLFANKTQSPKEWKEYFITESNQATKWLIRLGLSQYTAVFKEHEYETMHHLIQLSHEDLEKMDVSVSAHRKTILNGITVYLNLVTTFLSHLGFEQYASIFEANECKSMEDIQDLTVDDLKEMGIKAFGARNRIIRGIKEHFTTAAAATNPMQRNEERKENDTANILDGNSSIEANKPIKRADNPLTMFFGIERYLGKMYKNLNDIHDDERRLRHTFEEELGYQFESNEYKDKIWTKADIVQWIRSKRDEILIKKGRVQYNALIFCAASHGSTHSIICSDGQPLETSTIRSMFAWNVNESFTNMPKVFIFNCCRTPFVKQPANSIARGGPGAGYGLTMTGTEGKEVFGAKLSSFVAAAFSESEGKRGLYDIFKSAKEKAKYEMGLALQEHDPDVDDVIFAKKPVGRGSELRAQSDGAAQVVDDDVRNILKPIQGSMDLLKYLDPLRAAGVTNADELRKLTKERLKEKGINMKIFHEKELLKRIARDNMDFVVPNDTRCQDDNATASTAHALLKEWGLHKYAEELIDENGYDDVADWPDLTQDELMNEMGFKKGSAKKFVRLAKTI